MIISSVRLITSTFRLTVALISIPSLSIIVVDICSRSACSRYVRWERADEYSPFLYYLPDGSELSLGVGHSYVGIMGDDYAAGISFSREE